MSRQEKEKSSQKKRTYHHDCWCTVACIASNTLKYKRAFVLLSVACYTSNTLFFMVDMSIAIQIIIQLLGLAAHVSVYHPNQEDQVPIPVFHGKKRPGCSKVMGWGGEDRGKVCSHPNWSFGTH
jgi:hypothetical protein